MRLLALVLLGTCLIGAVLTSAIAQRPDEQPSTQLHVTGATLYPPGDDAKAQGICVRSEVTTEELHPGPFGFMLNIEMVEGLDTKFEIVDAVLCTSEMGKDKIEAKYQPFFNRDKPKNLSSQILVKELPKGSYSIDFYLKPQHQRVSPKEGLSYLVRDADRDRNFRVTSIRHRE